MDRAPERAEEASRRALASLEPGVRLRRLRIREAAGEHFADVVVTVEPDAAVAQGHAVADSVELTVEEAIKRTSSATGAVDVVVHVEPGEATGTLRERATAAAYTVVGIREVHNVRVLEVTGGRELSMHLKLPNDLPLERAHEVASEVASAVRDALPELARVHTHIEPLEEPEPGERFRVDGHHQEMLREIERVVRNAGVEANAHEVGLYRSGGGGLDAVLHCDFSRSVEVEEVHVRTEVIERALRSRFPELEQILVHAEPRQEP
jgi:divalent metal cation (Fe/Co/Zn/Cd) transporter